MEGRCYMVFLSSGLCVQTTGTFPLENHWHLPTGLLYVLPPSKDAGRAAAQKK